MPQSLKKAGIVIMATIFLISVCLPILTLPSKIYAETYAIGDTGPAGGIVFYDKGYESEGWRYLEAAPFDGLDIQWYNSFNLFIGTSSEIGTGKANTQAIINAQGSGNYAAKFCSDLVINHNGVNYDDWFLPSYLELIEMMQQQSKIPGLINWYVYWSSTDRDSYYAYCFVIREPELWRVLGKTSSTYMAVRPIRAFGETKATGNVEPVWIRDTEMKCKVVWINEDGDFQFSFIYPYADNNWLKIYDTSGKEVYSFDMPYDNPNIIVDLPDGRYTVKTFHDQPEPLQTFVIGKP